MVFPSEGGKPSFAPPRPITLAVSLALFCAALVVLGRMGLWGEAIPASLFRIGRRILVAVFLARAIGNFKTVGFFKAVRDSPFARWDTRAFSPLCLALAA